MKIFAVCSLIFNFCISTFDKESKLFLKYKMLRGDPLGALNFPSHVTLLGNSRFRKRKFVCRNYKSTKCFGHKRDYAYNQHQQKIYQR